MQVSKQVVGAAAGAFVVLIVIIAFLLGRESQRHERRRVEEPQLVGAVGPAQQAPSPAPSDPSSPIAPTPAPPSPTPSQDPLGPPTTAPSPSPAPAPAPAPAPSPTPAPSGASTGAQIRDYFVHMDSIQTGGMGDMEEMAGKLLTGAMKGDTSGLDDLVKSLDDSIAKVKAITPPPECVGYHGKMIEMIGQSQQLMRSLKQAMQSQDPSAIAGLAMTGQQLQAKADALQAEAKSIRSRAGL